MEEQFYAPIYKTIRGETIESVHFGAVAVVDVYGKLLSSYGSPEAVTFLRSSAKPFQVLPFLEHGGQDKYNLSERQVALLCASHSGTDEHVRVIRQIQEQTGVDESDLLCGTHSPIDEAAAEILNQRGEQPTPNRHNCSGKHTGMVAFARMMGYSLEDNPYISFDHPIQREIIHTFAEMCSVPVSDVGLGIDGCSAPNFAVPLKNVAFAFARLCDPDEGGISSPVRAAACRKVYSAMTSVPDMVAGPGRFDTCLMEAGAGRILSKGGAEGYQAIGLKPGSLGPGSPAVGIALKISDGDGEKRARSAVALEVLRQLDALHEEQLQALKNFGPECTFHNYRNLRVGIGRPVFSLNNAS